MWLLLRPWAKYIQVKKPGSTNEVRRNDTECVVQLRHIFSNAKPGEKSGQQEQMVLSCSLDQIILLASA